MSSVMPRLSRLSRRGAAGMCAAALTLNVIAPLAEAASLSWVAAANGALGTAANWNPAQVPTASDLLRFDVGPGPYTVTCGAAVPSVVSHDYRQGTVYLQCNQPHDITTQLTVGSGAGQVVTMRLQSGTLESGWSTLVGTGAGADGTLQVIGGDANLVQNSTVASPVFTVGGANATGTLRVATGGSVQVATDLDAGLHAGSLGTVRVVGESGGASPRASQLLLNSVAGDLRLGSDNGHGVLEVTDGGLVHVEKDLVLAEDAGDVADLTVSGAGALGDSRVEVNGNLWLGANAAGGSAAGTATATLADGSAVDVAGTTTIGDADGSTATLVMQTGSLLATHSLVARGAGPLDGFTGGLLQVDGGSFTSGIAGMHLAGGAAGPELQLINGATGSFSTLPVLPSFVVGDGLPAHVTLLGASSLTTSGGRMVLGLNAGSSGHLQVRESSSFTSGARLDVGDLGDGELHVWSGSQASAAGVSLARTAGSTGLLTIRDPNTLLTVTDRFDVGGTSAAIGGTAEAQVNLWGKLALQKTGVTGRIWPGSHVDVADLGTLELSGSLEVLGELSVANGTVTGGTVTLMNGGMISGFGNVVSTVTTGTDTTTRIVATGTLTFGSTLGSSLFTNRGMLEVGPHLVTLRASGTQPIGNVTLAGGTLKVDHLGTLELGKRITGTGTVSGNVVVLGDVVASGPAGLSFSGTLTGTGTGIGGTLLHLTPAGNFSGGGHMDLPVLADAGSSLLLTSDLVIGQAGIANAVQLAGNITIGSRLLELRSATEAALAGSTTLSLGVLRLTGGSPRIRIPAGAHLTGKGTIDAPLTVDGELVLQSFSGATAVTGAYASSATSSTTFELINGSLNSFGRIAASGALNLGGTINVHCPSTWRPTAGLRLQVLSGSSRTGTYSTLLYEGLPATGQYSMEYTSTGAWIVFSDLLDVSDTPLPSLPATLEFAAKGSPGPGVALELGLPTDADVRLDLFDLHGRRTASLCDASLGAGRHHFDLRGAGLGAGVYHARVHVVSPRGTDTRIARFVMVR